MLKSRANLNISCSQCPVKNLCLPKNLIAHEVELLNNMITKIKVVSKGEHIFHAEDPMHALYAVYSGSCKDYWVDENGNERIDNFYLVGDIIGLESLPQRKHFFSLVALEDAQLCMIPIEPLFEMMLHREDVLRRVINISGYKMQNDKHIRITTNASQRVADFILNILYRLQERQRYYGHICLPMSQLDISSCLGMAHETVNRILRKFQKEMLIRIENKTIYIINVAGLESIGTSLHRFGQAS